MSYHANYDEAFKTALTQANATRRDQGLEKWKSELTPGMKFRVFPLPSAGNRYGFELRCQVVMPEIMTDKEFKQRGYAT